MREHNITVIHQWSLDRGRLHALEDVYDVVLLLLLLLCLHVYGDGNDGVSALWAGRHSAGAAAGDRRVFRDGVLVAEVPSINNFHTALRERGLWNRDQ